MLKIDEVAPDAISQDDYQATGLDGLFINPSDSTAIFVSRDYACKITLPEN